MQKFKSPEAEHLYKEGLVAEAHEVEALYLPAKGRVTDSTGRVNPFGKMDGARLVSYNSTTKTYRMRVDDSHVSEFWLEVDIPEATLAACKQTRSEDQ